MNPSPAKSSTDFDPQTTLVDLTISEPRITATPPVLSEVGDGNAGRSTEHLKGCTQSLLKKARKMKRSSCHGTKQALLSRLLQQRVDKKFRIAFRPRNFDLQGSDSVPTTCRSRTSSCVAHDIGRLCDIIYDPRPYNAVARLHNGAISRAKVDTGIHDP